MLIPAAGRHPGRSSLWPLELSVSGGVELGGQPAVIGGNVGDDVLDRPVADRFGFGHAVGGTCSRIVSHSP